MSDLHTYGVRCPKCNGPERPLPNDGRDILFECQSSMGVSWGEPVPDRFTQSATCQLIVAMTDAARYRFIRDNLAVHTEMRKEVSLWGVQGTSIGGWHPTFDAAIDSMIEQQKAAGGGE